MVTPYFTQHSPPALVATLPPIEQISNDDGSGGYQRPCSAAAALDLDVERAGLDDGGARGRVDLDGAHPLEAEHDARRRSRWSRRRARCPRRGARRVCRAAPAQRTRGLHVGGARRADHGERHTGAGVSRCSRSGRRPRSRARSAGPPESGTRRAPRGRAGRERPCSLSSREHRNHDHVPRASRATPYAVTPVDLLRARPADRGTRFGRFAAWDGCRAPTGPMLTALRRAPLLATARRRARPSRALPRRSWTRPGLPCRPGPRRSRPPRPP